MNVRRGLVSVIIPAFNAERFLLDAVQSVVSQTYRNFEIIIVNDGSRDATGKIAESLRQKYPTIITTYAQVNRGQAAARNKGMRESKGEFIAFLDADDVWQPEKLAEQMQILSETGADLCCARAMVIGGMRADQVFPSGNGFISLYDLLRTNVVVNSSVVLRRSVFESIGEEKVYLRRAQDYDYWIRAVAFGYKLFFLDAVLVVYRVHDQQTTIRDTRKTYWYLSRMYLSLLFSPRMLRSGCFFQILRMISLSIKNILW